MNINNLLDGKECSCGKKHVCNIKYVYIEKDAIRRLERICDSYSSLLLIADENTFSAAGELTENVIGDKITRKVIFSGKEILLPDEKAIAEAESALDGIDLIIGIGSGVIQDLCKYVSHFNKIPYVIIATTPSMDGYASNGAAMITDGMKVTYSAGLPLAIVSDTSVIKNAPMDMIVSGYGDIIGKFSALNDWKLSHAVNDEYFCSYIYDLTYNQIMRTIDLADGILNRDEKSIGTLMEALVVIGILMSFAGSSRPASGSEHHLSHFFEITGIIDGSPYLSHGTDVAYSTFATAQIREKILSGSFPQKSFRQSDDEYKKIMQTIYKSSAEGCIELQNKTGNYKKDRTTVYLNKENEIRKILSEMPSSAYIKELLLKVGLDVDDFYAFYGTEKINNALLYAKDLKDRYTVLWMYYDFAAHKE